MHKIVRITKILGHLIHVVNTLLDESTQLITSHLAPIIILFPVPTEIVPPLEKCDRMESPALSYVVDEHKV